MLMNNNRQSQVAGALESETSKETTEPPRMIVVTDPVRTKSNPAEEHGSKKTFSGGFTSPVLLICVMVLPSCYADCENTVCSGRRMAREAGQHDFVFSSHRSIQMEIFFQMTEVCLPLLVPIYDIRFDTRATAVD